MAYTVTARDPSILKNVGVVHNPDIRFGVTTLSGGAATVSIPNCRRIVAAFTNPGSANTTYVSATSTNTFTIAGNGSDTVGWLAIVE